MKDSIFWKKAFIPVYFIVAMLVLILFRFYIKTDNFSVYLMIIFLMCFGTASIIYNYKNNR
ncbi:TPA: hypothetical protein OV885_001982 [Staphylococcus aureus]|uniref:Uncharacterized protein n=3 Tax=Staphylococcus aureus TaxID=1280 RepID=A0A5S9I4Z3_STAAU|nr:hypothetical protein [Staphylococcus aureus]EJN0120997.1 hypothetical protein [Staphylococcus aureus]KKI66813.1 hypothetical protein UF67_0173 [Staphylococcus aureus]KMQ99315.1 membrane protein [Staphylococcus aureus]MBS3458517.1 hypothetical protein [Staphylococcus aureus]MBY0862898.1 hypothetical protein [Staphylococcus aureus]